MERMIERAEEELEILENEHPNRFNYLKIELQSFISLLRSQHYSSLPTSSSATTQASTSMKRKRASMKRRKDEDEQRRKNEVKMNKKKIMGENEHKDRVDVVLEKAHACLRKIQDFKFSLV